MSWLLKFLGGGNIGNMLIAAAVIAAVAGASGFGTGWALNGWRLGADVARLEGQNTAYAGANARCGVNVAEVKAAVSEIVKQGEQRAAEAAKAIKKAETAAVVHLNRAAGIINRPPVPPEQQCDVVRAEQIEYVKGRHDEP